MNYTKRICLLYPLLFLIDPFYSMANPGKESPRIVHIVNFIRQVEPRDPAVTEDVLYETVKQQVDLLTKYHLTATFLLQYDALINPRYQKLLKQQVGAGYEIGGWWEITQPHVEAAGLKWRGRYSWDWHANVGFSTGYTPAEREKLVDVYMEKFKAVFGMYPLSIGSWFIDEHTLGYMYDKYHIVASANCKDQVGTDGYTLWGGYWNQAYYPSRMNAYMPAQNASAQIGLPIFRMLGSDPIYQYDSGLGGSMGVETLEPVYGGAGGSHAWVEWFLKSLVEEPCLSFAYTQAGQENSFTWANMKSGLEMQFPILDSLRNAKKIKIETMAQTGHWFKEHFPVTPATSVTALSDYKGEGNKTVWYNSRYYRVNLLWNKNSFRFRDIHLFDERYASPYYDKPGTSTQCIFTTLPILDGNLWSKPGQLAGLRLMKANQDGTSDEIKCADPVVKELTGNVLLVEWKGSSGETFTLQFFEDRFELSSTAAKDFKWLLELTTAPNADLPFKYVEKNKITASLNEFNYQLSTNTGSFQKPATKDSFVFRILPEGNKLVLQCNTRMATK